MNFEKTRPTQPSLSWGLGETCLGITSVPLYRVIYPVRIVSEPIAFPRQEEAEQTTKVYVFPLGKTGLLSCVVRLLF